MIDSIKRYTVARDCSLRLLLAGTASVETPVVDALIEGITTGVLPETYVEPHSLNDILCRILNTARKADILIPLGTRVFWDDTTPHISSGADGYFFKVLLNFASVKDNTGTFYYISRKKVGGTVAFSHAYTMMGASIKALHPQVDKVFVREVVLSPLKAGAEKSPYLFDVLPVPSALVGTSDEAVAAAMEDIKSVQTTEYKSNKRYCGSDVDPCPAKDICPAHTED